MNKKDAWNGNQSRNVLTDKINDLAIKQSSSAHSEYFLAENMVYHAEISTESATGYGITIIQRKEDILLLISENQQNGKML